jgi:hypothetical protein
MTQLNQDIIDFHESVKQRVTDTISYWANELFQRHSVLEDFSWKQSLFSGPENREGVISGLQVNGEALVSTFGIRDFLFKAEYESKILKEKHPLFAQEIENDKDIQLAEAIEELLDFFHALCTPELCRFFGNRFAVQVNRNGVIVSEINL